MMDRFSLRARRTDIWVRSALAVTAAALFLGCDSRPKLATAPLEESSVDALNTSMVATPPDPFASEAASLDNALLDAGSTSVLGGPVAGLTGAELARFHAGLEDFQEIETVEDGLGPVFNEASCTTCHNAPVGGANGRAETRFGRLGRNGFDALEKLGGSLMQDHAIGRVNTEHGAYDFVAEVVPRSANVVALRITTPLFGLGLVDAVPDASFQALARYQARVFPSTRGIPNMVTEIATGALRVGRFGWKAQVPTLHQFAGDAYLNEMGITSPDFPEENYPQGNQESMAYNPFPEMNDDGEGVELFTDFMSMLGPPPRGPRSRQTDEGSEVFRSIGCVNCHTPTLVTGDHPIRALSRKAFQPYSDFLLHDMGSLGDGITQGMASGRLMRTAPLWGLRSRPTYLHDGRAKSPSEAILGHSGQGSDARTRYLRLGSRDRAALQSFLNSL